MTIMIVVPQSYRTKKKNSNIRLCRSHPHIIEFPWKALSESVVGNLDYQQLLISKSEERSGPEHDQHCRPRLPWARRLWPCTLRHEQGSAPFGIPQSNSFFPCNDCNASEHFRLLHPSHRNCRMHHRFAPRGLCGSLRKGPNV